MIGDSYPLVNVNLLRSLAALFDSSKKKSSWWWWNENYCRLFLLIEHSRLSIWIFSSDGDLLSSAVDPIYSIILLCARSRVSVAIHFLIFIPFKITSSSSFKSLSFVWCDIKAKSRFLFSKFFNWDSLSNCDANDYDKMNFFFYKMMALKF